MGSLRELERPETEFAQTPLRLAQEQFDGIARRLGLDSGAAQPSRLPMPEHRVAVPVRMNDDSVTVYLMANERVARACRERGWG